MEGQKYFYRNIIGQNDDGSLIWSEWIDAEIVVWCNTSNDLVYVILKRISDGRLLRIYPFAYDDENIDNLKAGE